MGEDLKKIKLKKKKDRIDYNKYKLIYVLLFQLPYFISSEKDKSRQSFAGLVLRAKPNGSLLNMKHFIEHQHQGYTVTVMK